MKKKIYLPLAFNIYEYICISTYDRPRSPMDTLPNLNYFI